MNYRHAFHAGNHADCLKHALLTALIHSLKLKPAPFAVLDTHAGTGRYALTSAEADRTGEWREGIGRIPVAQDAASPLDEYLSIVHSTGKDLYPGSPDIVACLLRPQDRLICCELHPEDFLSLRRLFRDNQQVSVHERDGYAAIRALWPVKNISRGLVLLDPPFEKPDDFSRLAEAIALSRQRLRGAIVAAWYPVKHRTPVRAFFNQLQDMGERKILTAELMLRPPTDPSRLNGSGLLIANPPWQFEKTASEITSKLATYLGDENCTANVEWIVPE